LTAASTDQPTKRKRRRPESVAYPADSYAAILRSMAQGETREFPAAQRERLTFAARRAGAYMACHFRVKTRGGKTRVTRLEASACRYMTLKATLQRLAVGEFAYFPLDMRGSVRSAAWSYGKAWGMRFRTESTPDEMVVERMS
jgi:hypothetical protein